MSRGLRASYDEVAGEYVRLVPDLRVEAPLDRAVLEVFTGLVPGQGHVADVGCGAGRITSHLSLAGLRVVGLDLSLGMIREARAAHPQLSFAVAELEHLPVQSASLAGLLAWYSIIHLPPDALPAVCTELARVARPGAPVVVAFQGGDGERVERASSYGLPVALTYYRHRVGHVTDLLTAAGFSLHATVVREPWLPHETTSQAFVLAVRQPSSSTSSQR